jgi:ADP-heptose:LPS heptosyltransferase/glycosyltransferase involved in cell wall biosynthesis
MANCTICKNPIKAFEKPNKGHLFVGMDNEGHVHTHGDIENKDLMQELVHEACETIGIAQAGSNGIMPKEVVFNNKQRIGDSFMFTCALRDFKRAFPNVKVGIRATAMHIWDHNPHIDRSIDAEDFKSKAMAQVADLPAEQREAKAVFDLGEGRYFIKVGPGALTNASNRLDWHFANAYRYDIERKMKLVIPQGESRPDIYFTEEEYNSARPFKDPYWVICVSGEKGWGCKMYPFDRWQKVVDQNPDINFVQIGTKGDNPPRLKGANVVDHVGKTEDKHTGVRELFKLFLHAEGSIGLVSFHMHLSGALYKPCVVVAGAREPVSFTRYPFHQYLATDGTLPCSTPACWHCSIDKCTNIIFRPKTAEQRIPKCVDMIDTDEVTQAIRRYYKGGLLVVGVPSQKPKIRKRPTDAGISVVPTPVSRPESVPGGFDAKAATGLDWGKGAIDPLDWPFLEEVIKKHQVKTVLEFGAGLSTKLISEMVESMDSFETEQLWIDKVAPLAPKARIHRWDGKDTGNFVNSAHDLAFVDGPANGQNREQAVRLAANHAKIVILHDATREYESQWEEKYLKPGFQGPIKGGKWCHMWIKTASFTPFAAPTAPPPNPNPKRVRIVSTARGWGGCARSVTTIMKMLLHAGHHVEFVPFRNQVTSREFIDALKNGLSEVRVRESYDAISEHCDTLLVYADDYVWEFPKMANEFSDMRADRRVMMLNYRVGEVGKVPWTRGFDRYLFLNSLQEKELLKQIPNADTGVYPPCVDLKHFFEVKPDYNAPLSIVRHNSQGDVKFDKVNASAEIAAALASRPDLNMHMLPGPSFVPASDRFKKYGRTGIPEQIADFLAKGNLFWYSLPKGYIDAGPRVILEAMAAGLPVIADNWGGAPDRVTPDCGWICTSKEEMLEIIKNVTPEELRSKGEAARARAMNEFKPERWIEELTGETACAVVTQ